MATVEVMDATENTDVAGVENLQAMLVKDQAMQDQDILVKDQDILVKDQDILVKDQDIEGYTGN